MTLEETLEGVRALQSAALEFAQAETTRVTTAVVAELCNRPAIGMFPETAARHMWDEYCWAVQEGPFDDDQSYGGMALGSISGNWDDTVRAFVQSHVEALPKHAQIFLSALAIDQANTYEARMTIGDLWIDGTVEQVMEQLSTKASRRQLDLIGPDRGEVIGYEILGRGLVWQELHDRKKASGIIESHVDDMIDETSDLSDPARDMVWAYIAAANEAVVDNFLADFFDIFEDDIREILLKKDVLPTLEDIRGQLLERLDG